MLITVNMKKIISVLALSIVLLLAACGNDEAKNNTPTDKPVQSTAVQTESPKATETISSDQINSAEFFAKVIDNVKKTKSYHMTYKDKDQDASVDFILDNDMKVSSARATINANDKKTDLVILTDKVYVTINNGNWKETKKEDQMATTLVTGLNLMNGLGLLASAQPTASELDKVLVDGDGYKMESQGTTMHFSKNYELVGLSDSTTTMAFSEFNNVQPITAP